MIHIYYQYKSIGITFQIILKQKRDVHPLQQKNKMTLFQRKTYNGLRLHIKLKIYFIEIIHKCELYFICIKLENTGHFFQI